MMDLRMTASGQPGKVRPADSGGPNPALASDGARVMPVGNRVGRARQFALHAVERRLLLLIGDAGTWWLGGVLTIALLRPPRFNVASGPRSALIAVIAVLAWWLWAWVNGAYDIQLSSRLISLVAPLARAMLFQTLSFVALAFFARGFTGRVVWAWWLIIAFVLLLAWRSLYLSVLTLPMFARQIVFTGNDKFLQQLLDGVLPRWSGHYRVLGYVESGTGSGANGGLPVVGELRQLPVLADELQAREVVVGKDALQDTATLEQLISCRNLGIKVTPAAQFYEELTGQVPLSQIDHYWIMDLPNRALQNRPYTALKRLVDIVLSLIGLVGFAILVPFIALAIWLDSGRPIFYTQERTGLHGRLFRVIKFRTMRADAEADNEARWAMPGDERVTRVGRVLRRLRLDELPQVLNILKGEMTVVGPRPERPEMIATLEASIPFYRTRLEVKPGLTGWAQVNEGYGSSIEDTLTKLQYDLYYVKHQSLVLDASIVLKTAQVVLGARGR
jgi:exopolysaccharide biosynthesis polyprenyl glycosylphosphotransferase